MALVLTCKICGLPHSGKTVQAKEMMFGLGDSFLYFQCGGCQCLQIAEFPANLSHYYPTHYYSFAPYHGKKFYGLKGWFYKLRIRSTLFTKGLVHKIIHRLFPVSKLRIFEGLVDKKTRILDVGCGNGDMFLYPLKEAGVAAVAGCDPFIPNDITYKNGLKIYKSDAFNMAGTWDLVIYNHAFEHVPDPFENLKRVAEILPTGGVCILRIPTVPNYAWEHYGVNWAQLDAPRHLFLHSPISIRLLAEKAGMKLEKIIYDSTFFQFAGSEAIANGIPLIKISEHQNNFLKRKLDRIRYNHKANILNKEQRGDQATFYLVKG